MNTSLLIGLLGCGVSLLCSLFIFLQHRRSGTPLPGYEFGAALGCIGLTLVLVGTSSLVEDRVSIALLLGSAPFVIGSIVLVHRARQRTRACDR